MLSAHFADAEFRCPDACLTTVVVSPRLIDVLEAMRAMLGPIRVSSGVRCPRHNREVGGVPSSEHLTGEGADLACDTAQRRYAMVDAALKAGVRRIGVGDRFVHVGVSASLPQEVLWLYGPSRFAA